MSTISTGYEVPDYSKAKDSGAVSPTPPEKVPKKTVYPDITLRGEAADALMKQFEAGADFTATVTFHMSRCETRKGTPRDWENTEDANRSTCDLEVRSMETEGGDSAMAENEGGDDSAEGAVDSYLSGKNAPPPDDGD